MRRRAETPERARRASGSLALLLAAAFAGADPAGADAQTRNVILFVGDGMGVTTVSFTRFGVVGVDGRLVMDQFPYTALSRTSTADHITPDSAGTMTAMTTGVNTNSGVIGYPPTTERSDFNGDGDGTPLTSIAELAKARGYSVGVVTTARLTHATPAAVYAHVNDRNRENDIAAQLAPGGPGYNRRLGPGLDVLFGGGRRFFLPTGMTDEEGSAGRRTDGRDLRAEFRRRGYAYVWNQAGFDALPARPGRVIGLFDSSHLEYEFDRSSDQGGEPSLTALTRKAIRILEGLGRPYFLMVESGRIDHAHHAGNAYRSLYETAEFDEAIGAATWEVDLRETMILVTADHGHVFTLAGYAMRPIGDLQYAPTSVPGAFADQPYNGIFGAVYDLNPGTGAIYEAGDARDVPYTILGYGNGPGHRPGPRVDPNADATPGYGGEAPANTASPAYLQEAAVPLSAETHSAEDVAVYGIGAGSEVVRGTVPNTRIFDWMAAAMGLDGVRRAGGARAGPDRGRTAAAPHPGPGSAPRSRADPEQGFDGR